ncbi:hypothetical protein FRC02_005128 [Tulasnella sp. 418]|nr:hypothetical protein FRC02_005128 [Tulasnella sp. 418]
MAKKKPTKVSDTGSLVMEESDSRSTKKRGKKKIEEETVLETIEEVKSTTEGECPLSTCIASSSSRSSLERVFQLLAVHRSQCPSAFLVVGFVAVEPNINIPLFTLTMIFEQL